MLWLSCFLFLRSGQVESLAGNDLLWQLDTKLVSCLCVCLLDLATDQPESRSAALDLPLYATPGELGLGSGYDLGSPPPGL